MGYEKPKERRDVSGRKGKVKEQVHKLKGKGREDGWLARKEREGYGTGAGGVVVVRGRGK